tara:strand:- start:8438 stop:8767 length:330 start_codon:yes stop_codon:yes gene_type:complete
MPKGKLSAQSGHAFEYAMSNATLKFPIRAKKYKNPNLGGSKISLYIKSEKEIIELYNKLLSEDIPCSIVVDKNHVLPPHFDGSPIITALGIGPVSKKETRHLLSKLKLV